MLKIKHMNDNRYTINGMLVLATNYKAAIAEYISITNGGAKVLFARKG